MSLWHENNLKKDKDKFPNLPDLEPLPELDDLFDEFDSGGLLAEDNVKEEHTYEDIEDQLQSYAEPEEHIEQDELPREVDNTSDSSNEYSNVEYEEPEVEYEEPEVMSLPSVDDDLEDVQELEPEAPVREVVEHEMVVQKTPTYKEPEEVWTPPEYDEEIEKQFEDIEEEDEEDQEDFKEIEDEEEEEDLEAPDLSFEEFETIDEEKVYDPEYDKVNDEEVLSAADDDPYGYNLEEGFQGSLLPGVNLDEDERSLYERQVEEEEEEDYEDDYEEEESQPVNEKGFRELDEERIKELFTGIFAKFKGKNKPNKPKGLKKPSVKPSSPKRAKDKQPMNKSTLIYIGIGAGVIALLVALYFMWGNSYDELSELESTATIVSDFDDEEDTEILLGNMELNEAGGLTLDITNNGDISQEFTMYMSVKGKPAVPLLGKKVHCESDIMIIEPGATVNDSLSCTGEIDNDVNFKVTDVEIDQF